jgi:GNAT superfamily N-acetyltransferase
MLTVRHAVTTDLGVVAELGVRTYFDHYRDLWAPAELEVFLEASFGRAALERDLADPDVSYLLADDGQALVGYAKTIANRAPPVPPHERGMELQKIYFRREATGRGYGAVVLEHVIARARAGPAAAVARRAAVERRRAPLLRASRLPPDRERPAAHRRPRVADVGHAAPPGAAGARSGHSLDCGS